MNESIAAIARASAQRLTPRYGPRLATGVEAALHTTDRRPQQYTDPVAIGGLIVAVASLAWTVYWNLKQGNPQPPQHVMVRTIRLELSPSIGLDPDERNRIIDAVVIESIAIAGDQPQDTELDDKESM